MNRFKQALGFIIAVFFIAVTLCGSVAAVGLEQTDTKQLAQVIIRADRGIGPSAEADLFYRILVAEVAGKRGKLDVALENYRIAATSSNDPKVAERAVGIALFMENDPVTLEIARRWSELAPDDIQARQSLALALLSNEQIEEALEHLETVRTAQGDNEQEGFAIIAALLRQVKDKDIVLKAMQELRVRHPQSLYALYHYALAALAVENYDQALEGLDGALTVNPQWGPAHLLRTQIKMQQGEPVDEALSALASAVSTQPEDQSLRMGYARLLVGAERLDEAGEQFKILAEQNPQDAESFYALGLLAAEAKQFDAAVDYFMQVLKLGARIMDVYYELGRVEETRENFDEARKWYARVQNDERYISAQIRIANIMALQGDFDGMSRHLADLRTNHPDNAVALYLAEAEILREEKRFQPSFDKLTQALQEFPEHQDLLYTRALVAEKLDRLDILEQDLRKIIEVNPDSGHALNALGYTLADRTDRYQEAYDYLQRAIALLPDDPAVLDSMGWIKYRLGDYEESLDYLRRAYKLNTDPEIASHLSEVLWNLDQREEARDIWQRAIEQAPDNEYLLDLKERFGL